MYRFYCQKSTAKKVAKVGRHPLLIWVPEILFDRISDESKNLHLDIKDTALQMLQGSCVRLDKSRLPDDAMIMDAFLFAQERHAGQTRRGTGLPYITHPLGVSYLVAEFRSSKHLKDLIIAALLHDLLEDTKTTFQELSERFTPLSASLVLEMSSDQDEIQKIGKKNYFKKKLLGLSNYGLFLKLCDRLHNVSDRPHLKMMVDTMDILQHVRELRKFTASQNKLADKIVEVISGHQRYMDHLSLQDAENQGPVCQ